MMIDIDDGKRTLPYNIADPPQPIEIRGIEHEGHADARLRRKIAAEALGARQKLQPPRDGVLIDYHRLLAQGGEGRCYRKLGCDTVDVRVHMRSDQKTILCSHVLCYRINLRMHRLLL
ncbi:hypothetical protein AMJ39_00260 [candidate division TA06 bacterium DG_24]|uniref:Uncharacterized protein n=3 Tax=Bacteria division TA06 TaxID=1156500 RepID=A0A0S8JP27_UNCT6|nr:MAG: hypothetical protein AMJ39_00260 [candidate division TA06 bacterium DG_24]KPK69050.1 MAG: hypothetical protein AMJ82_06645 [candidate division TA06 bacterium SM23_40]KPL10509.1 MAG: hypothetical protein AMJ71_02835 [candidate division TA06 bacterium SM1_40]